MASSDRPSYSSLASSSTPSNSPLSRPLPLTFQTSPSPSLVSSPRYVSFSAASQAGSAISTTPTPSRFKRGHARVRTTTPTAKQLNPDDFDLMLDDPDEVFRLFGVRDVQGLEKRAREAADTKVADLRTMVGERYRDLLSAADSIVRMREASEKLVDGLTRVGNSVAITSARDTPSKRVKTAARRLSLVKPPESTLESPATLSLTIHLLLSLPSLVHTLLESSSFLTAARLEGVGRVIYRELLNYSYGESEGNVIDNFPIIERNWESIGSLESVITRRASTELRSWTTSPHTTAETLASISMLKNSTLDVSLQLLLDARTTSLNAILTPTIKSARHHDLNAVLQNLSNALSVILQTVSSAREIFGAEAGKIGLLLNLLEEIENPSGPEESSTDQSRLSPALATLPNYSLLKRHLPPAILDFTPFLSIESQKNSLSPKLASEMIDSWLATATETIVKGVVVWITNLKGSAQTLAAVRAGVRKGLEGSGAIGVSLKKALERAVEARLEKVYQDHLAIIVSRVPKCLEELIIGLPTSLADSSPSNLLFELDLPFPSTALQSKPTRNSISSVKAVDPFELFLRRAKKRVQGRSPLIDGGILELESHARDLRNDLEGWMSSDDDEIGKTSRLKMEYVQSAKETFDGIYKALLNQLELVADDVQNSLFIGNFALVLSNSPSFTRDLLLGSASLAEPLESATVKEWHERLLALQSQSLQAWRYQAAHNAVGQVEKSMNVAVQGSEWNISCGLPTGTDTPPQFILPSQPSSFLLSSLRILVSAVLQIGAFRILLDPTITPILLKEYQTKVIKLFELFLLDVKVIDNKDKQRGMAIQAIWDIKFLENFWPEPCAAWQLIENTLVEITNASDVAIKASALQYLQRTQTFFSPILPPLPNPSSTSLLLPIGIPIIVNEFKSAVGMVKAGVRLGLLPTRS